MAASDQDIIARMRVEHLEFLAEIFRANEDLEDRIVEQGMDVVYDHEDDMLFLTIGKSEEAAVESVRNVMLVRYNPESLKIVGLEVLELKANMDKYPSLCKMYERAVREPRAVAETARELAAACWI